MLDIDGDGYEQTGWNLLYMHISNEDKVDIGEKVYLDDLIGHPSCEGGSSTGTHLHFARKYNGEWMVVDKPLPFILSGWQVIAGDDPYEGFMINNGSMIKCSSSSEAESLIIRK